MAARSSGDQTRRLLRRVAVVALVDTTLLAALLAASLTDSEALATATRRVELVAVGCFALGALAAFLLVTKPGL